MSITHFKGSEVTLDGTDLSVGDKAPVVTVTSTGLEDIQIGGENEKVQLIISVPSLDTKTCAMETKKFNQEVGMLEVVDTFVVSMDLPFASERFCSTEGINSIEVVSDYVEKEFSKNYGVLMADNKLKGLCARAVFVVNKDGVITYKEVVNEVTEQPNYEAVLEAIKAN
jgi:thiol peroxidase